MSVDVSQANESLLVTVPEAAKILGIGKTLMWDSIYAGRIPIVRFGRRVLVARQVLCEVAASGSLVRKGEQSE